MVDSEKFKLAFAVWMQKTLQNKIAGKTVAIDGKSICGTSKYTSSGEVLHIASAIVSEFNLVIGSTECATKTGEITAFRELIELLDVNGAVVVADALHCNPKSAEAVIAANADYLFVVKDNQEILHKDLKLHFKDEAIDHQTKEINGSRFETRTAYVSYDVNYFNTKDKWPKLVTVGAIHREFEEKGQKSSEWHYYISSKKLNGKELLHHARMEWRVESMHWLLDVHFTEDKSKVRDMNVEKLLNTSRKIALNLVRLFKEANCKPSLPLTSIFKQNLFDLAQFARFLAFFRLNLKLD